MILRRTERHDVHKENGAMRTAPILIVEDDRKTSELLTIYLEREGFATLAATRAGRL